jgi:hypothetical protein
LAPCASAGAATENRVRTVRRAVVFIHGLLV